MKTNSDPELSGPREETAASNPGSPDLPLDDRGKETVTSARASGPPTRPLSRRLMLSALVILLCLAAGYVSLPFLQVRKTWANPTGGAMWSPMTLGVRPILTGFILVELAALIVPSWRRLRVGSPAARQVLRRKAVAVGMILTASQAFFLVRSLQQADLLKAPQFLTGSALVLILVGMSAALLASAAVVQQQGLGSGFGILLLADCIPELVACFRSMGATLPTSVGAADLAVDAFIAVGVPVLVSGWLMSSRGFRAFGSSEDHLQLGRPACGLSPVAIGAAGAVFVAAITRVLSTTGYTSVTPPVPSLMLAVTLAVASSAVLALLYNLPERVHRSWGALLGSSAESMPRFGTTFLECALFAGGLSALEHWRLTRLGGIVPSVATTILVTAIVADLVREWRMRSAHAGLTSIWEIHQVYAIAPALRLLADHGIQAFPQARHHRALLQFFGPYIPVQLLVPSADAVRARALIESRWPVGE